MNNLRIINKCMCYKNLHFARFITLPVATYFIVFVLLFVLVWTKYIWGMNFLVFKFDFSRNFRGEFCFYVSRYIFQLENWWSSSMLESRGVEISAFRTYIERTLAGQKKRVLHHGRTFRICDHCDQAALSLWRTRLPDLTWSRWS